MDQKMKNRNMSEEIGLLRVLLEQAPSTCPCISGLNTLSKEEFESDETGYDQNRASKDDLYYDWEPDDPDADPVVFSLDNLLISSSPGTALEGYAGEAIQDLYNNIIDGSEDITRENTVVICDLWVLINHIITTNAQGHQSTLQTWNTELCRKATEIWTEDIQTGVEDPEGFYIFTYDGGETSPQVNNIFKEKVLDLLGFTDSQKFSDDCVANVKVTQDAPDEYVDGIRVSGYEYWNGFMVKHHCVSPANTYYSRSLDISQDLPDNFYERVLKFKMRLAMPPDIDDFENFERSQQGQGTPTNQNVSVSVDDGEMSDDGEEIGLSQVITKTSPYEDIVFL